jgi:predicted RNA-binding protein YlqC (UPF0109 family)
MKEFVEYIVKNLVDHPDAVKITQIQGSHTIILELTADKTDVGKIVGKHGKTINAIRTLLMSVAARGGVRVNLELIDETGQGRRPRGEHGEQGERGERPPRGERGERGPRQEGGRHEGGRHEAAHQEHAEPAHHAEATD